MSVARSSAIRVDVPVFGQEEAQCGVASLKSVLWFLGHRVSAGRLARFSGAGSDGIDHGPLVRAARKRGFAVFSRANGSIADLRRFLKHGHPVIVGWWSQDKGDLPFDPGWSLAERRKRDCGHYSVVCGIDKTRVLLMDPQWEERGGRLKIVGRRWMPTRHFRRVWYDTNTDRYTRVDRWFMVVHLPR